MIHLQDFHIRLESVKSQLTNRLFHSYLNQNIGEPIVDEDKLLLLVALLSHLGRTKDEIDNYSVTTMLLQIALDTHDHVQNSIPNEDVTGQKNRQLAVLAGTYYSGLFYQQLAHINDIEMITTLAAGVKEVNEHKISVYRKELDAIDKLMNSVKLIESSLFIRIAERFDAVAWSDLLANYLFVKRLTEERNQFLVSGKSIVFDCLKKLSFQKNNQDLTKISPEQQRYLLSICERYIDFSINLIEAATKQLPPLDNLLKNRLEEIFRQRQSITKITLEEG
ncbi:heptaprenyl diphosphate synthase component 1 [Mesobacillus maritimus]|uniref:heptaprenyl diphosphate synthase component 1 n=1 Tax=Mesobacillus maritimus TaxID=1643336 RepID=UPI0032E7F886